MNKVYLQRGVSIYIALKKYNDKCITQNKFFIKMKLLKMKFNPKNKKEDEI